MNQYTRFLPLFFCSVLLAATCRQPTHEKGPAIWPYFQAVKIADTLRFEVADHPDSLVLGNTIPNDLFFTTVPADLLNDIDYLADSAQALVMGRQRFAWNDSMEAYWVDIRQFWFQHQSLLLYDKRRQMFTGRVTVAEWYGGDGGQILIGSWLFDYEADGQKDLIRREIEHSTVPDGDETKDVLHESAVRLLWRDGRFMELPVEDSSLIAKHFPIRSFW